MENIKRSDVVVTLHNCNIGTVKPEDCYRSLAVEECWEDENGKLWVGNDEYANTVNFCPICGYKSLKLNEYLFVGKETGEVVTKE